MLKNQDGLSLVSVMIAAGLLGIVGMGVMRLQQNMDFIKQDGKSAEETTSLTHEIRIMLQIEDACRTWIASDTDGATVLPMTFFKSTNSTFSKKLGATSANYNEAPPKAKFWAGKNYGALTIKNIELDLSASGSSNYEESLFHQDIAYLKVLVEKKVGDKDREIILSPPDGMPVMLTMKTDASGKTTVLGCREGGANQTDEEKILCYGQGGASFSSVGWYSSACRKHADAACSQAPNCKRKSYNVFGGSPYCAWSCEPST